MVDVASTGDGGLRWRKFDGTSGALSRANNPQQVGDDWTSTLGWTGRPDGIRVAFDCAKRTIRFAGIPGSRIAFDVTETRFRVEGATLAGRLVMPRGRQAAPIVILVHGAEHNSARDSYALQRLFPAAGIGAFVYDKRGTGVSDGRYTQDYLMLATDAIAALHEAKRLAGRRAGRIGYQAGSQGGWVAPLAAKIEPVDFVIVSFGLAVSPLAAERESIVHDVVIAEPGREGSKAAEDIAEAEEALVTSNFRDGYDQLAAARSKYSARPWFGHVGTGFTQFLLGTPAETVRAAGPAAIPSIPFDYDPMPVLRHLDTPQLWVLGGKDRDAPPGETARRLKTLADTGRPITVAIYPKAEHGMYEFDTAADGARLSTHQPPGYFSMMRDFILKGRLVKAGSYGASIVARRGTR
jgi:pimeloyl-ACP methyl ester carboxylesterase